MTDFIFIKKKNHCAFTFYSEKSKQRKQASKKKNPPSKQKKNLIVSHHRNSKNPEEITTPIHIHPAGRHLEKSILMTPLQTVAGQRKGSKILRSAFFPFIITASDYQQPAPNRPKLLNFHPEGTHTKSSPRFAVIQHSYQSPRTNTSF